MSAETVMNRDKDMIISHQHILTLDGIKGFGPKKIHTIAEYLRNQGAGQLSDREMCDVISELVQRRALKGVKEFYPGDFMVAADNARRILDKTLASGFSMVTRYDESYPKALLHTVNEDGKESVPVFLFYKGDLGITRRKSIAIIGTREPSPEGETASKYFAKALAEKGINIVSGLALGCDTAAHKGALEGHGITTATLGGGLDKIYPSENTELADRIVNEGGLLLTEYPVGEEATSYNLVARDRLQAALSNVILVIQTSVSGGTLHAVNAASAVSKPVFAVDYKIDLPVDYIGGNRLLIQKGMAKSIDSSEKGISMLLSCLETAKTDFIEGTQLSIF